MIHGGKQHRLVEYIRSENRNIYDALNLIHFVQHFEMKLQKFRKTFSNPRFVRMFFAHTTNHVFKIINERHDS